MVCVLKKLVKYDGPVQIFHWIRFANFIH